MFLLPARSRLQYKCRWAHFIRPQKTWRGRLSQNDVQLVRDCTLYSECKDCNELYNALPDNQG